MKTQEIVILIMATIVFIVMVATAIKGVFLRDLSPDVSKLVGNIIYLITGSLLGYVGNDIKNKSKNGNG